jgi:hypothetical protein
VVILRLLNLIGMDVEMPQAGPVENDEAPGEGVSSSESLAPTTGHPCGNEVDLLNRLFVTGLLFRPFWRFPDQASSPPEKPPYVLPGKFGLQPQLSRRAKGPGMADAASRNSIINEGP